MMKTLKDSCPRVRQAGNMILIGLLVLEVVGAANGVLRPLLFTSINDNPLPVMISLL